jgi:hypothetical protein
MNLHAQVTVLTICLVAAVLPVVVSLSPHIFFMGSCRREINIVRGLSGFVS